MELLITFPAAYVLSTFVIDRGLKVIYNLDEVHHSYFWLMCHVRTVE